MRQGNGFSPRPHGHEPCGVGEEAGMQSMYSPREQAADRRNHSPEAEAYREAHGITCDCEADGK